MPIILIIILILGTVLIGVIIGLFTRPRQIYYAGDIEDLLTNDGWSPECARKAAKTIRSGLTEWGHSGGENMKSIIFNSEMVRAILDEKKTQTRRVIKNMPEFVDCCFVKKGILEVQYWGKNKINYQPDMPANDKKILINCPYGKVGDKLWVKEAFEVEECIYQESNPYPRYVLNYKYLADGEIGDMSIGFDLKCKKYSPIYMPRWLSRITLETTNIRVERVQNISDDDALEEAKMFKGLWNSINEKRGFGWEKNPFVWALRFKRA